MADHPNIVLVTIDSLRADKTGLTPGKSFTPNLDQIANEGISYSNAVAPGPSTYESMPSIWTGELMGTVETDEDSELGKLSRRKQAHLRSTTLVEELDRLGYDSGAFTPNPHTSRGTGFSRGFDDYEDFLEGDIPPSGNG